MVNLNGQISSSTTTGVDFDNRGLHYGDAVFETIRYSAGKLFFWEDHYFRLMASMRILRMEIPMNFSLEFLKEEVLRTIATLSEEKKAIRIKILVWRQADGKYTPVSNDINYMITSEVLEEEFYILNENYYEVELFKDHYVSSGLLSTLKTNNRIINVLGGIYAKENGYGNCVLLNEKKQVVEALNGNLFLVKDNVMKTPPLSDGCLKGVLRKQLIEICSQVSDYELVEESISPFELSKANELFITNVISGIQPITKYRKKEFGSKVSKDLIGKLNAKARLG